MKAERRQIEGRTRGRLVIALMVSGPLGIILSELIYYGLATPTFHAPALAAQVQYIFLSALVAGAVLGWPVTVVLGLPGHIWLYRRRARKLANYILAGLGGGVIATVVFAVAMLLFNFGLLAAMVATGFALIFFSVAFVSACIIFWMIRRPDRDTASDAALTQMFS